MVEKVGRNDPCLCGSGKKYKSCCLPKEQQKSGPLGKRKFTAKIIRSGGMENKVSQSQEKEQSKPAVDYSTLMERSFGSALHSHDDKPPVPVNPSEYLVSEDSTDQTKN